MIRKKTVVITGAGANKEYGFPTGKDLQKEIPDKYIDLYMKHVPPDNFHQDWTQIEYDEHHYYLTEQLGFVDSYKAANLPIDQYISQQDRNRNFNKYAKHALILGLLEYEKKSNLIDNWLEEILTQMCADLHGIGKYKDIEKNNISFITFNYDRTIEQFFAQRIAQMYSIDESESALVVNNIPIHHVYGKIADLQWQNQDSFLKYGMEDNSRLGNYSWELCNNIDLIRFDRAVKELKSYKSIRALLNNAERLYILGFGFDTYNLSVLGFPDSIKNVNEIYSTRKGLVGRQIERTFNKSFRHQTEGLRHIYDYSCTDLLREFDME